MSVRKDRVSHQLQQEIANIVQFELKDPGLGFITITRVEVTADFSHAKVGFSCLGGDAERVQTQEALDRSAGFIRGQIGRRLRLKVTPEIVFKFDPSVAESIDMAAMLDRLKNEEFGAGG
jgi:ribosome-binding factor A